MPNHNGKRCWNLTTRDYSGGYMQQILPTRDEALRIASERAIADPTRTISIREVRCPVDDASMRHTVTPTTPLPRKSP